MASSSANGGADTTPLQLQQVRGRVEGDSRPTSLVAKVTPVRELRKWVKVN